MVWTSVLYRAWRLGLARPRLFSASPTLRLGRDYYARPRDGVRAAGHGDAG